MHEARDPDHPAQPSKPAYCETGRPHLRRTFGLVGKQSCTRQHHQGGEHSSSPSASRGCLDLSPPRSHGRGHRPSQRPCRRRSRRRHGRRKGSSVCATGACSLRVNRRTSLLWQLLGRWQPLFAPLPEWHSRQSRQDSSHDVDVNTGGERKQWKGTARGSARGRSSERGAAPGNVTAC